MRWLAAFPKRVFSRAVRERVRAAELRAADASRSWRMWKRAHGGLMLLARVTVVGSCGVGVLAASSYYEDKLPFWRVNPQDSERIAAPTTAVRTERIPHPTLEPEAYERFASTYVASEVAKPPTHDKLRQQMAALALQQELREELVGDMVAKGRFKTANEARLVLYQRLPVRLE